MESGVKGRNELFFCEGGWVEDPVTSLDCHLSPYLMLALLSLLVAMFCSHPWIGKALQPVCKQQKIKNANTFHFPPPSST